MLSPFKSFSTLWVIQSSLHGEFEDWKEKRQREYSYVVNPFEIRIFLPAYFRCTLCKVYGLMATIEELGDKRKVATATNCIGGLPFLRWGRWGGFRPPLLLPHQIFQLIPIIIHQRRLCLCLLCRACVPVWCAHPFFMLNNTKTGRCAPRALRFSHFNFNVTSGKIYNLKIKPHELKTQFEKKINDIIHLLSDILMVQPRSIG